MKRITITISESTAAALAELAKACSDEDKARNGTTTHGPLTPSTLLAMLAEDAGMVITRPGCWEASNMRQALVSHGYSVQLDNMDKLTQAAGFAWLCYEKLNPFLDAWQLIGWAVQFWR